MDSKGEFSRWKKSAQAYAVKSGCPDDIWAADDPYELLASAQTAYARGSSPSSFIEEMFAEDIAHAEHDDLLFNESINSNFEDDFGGEDG